MFIAFNLLESFYIYGDHSGSIDPEETTTAVSQSYILVSVTTITSWIDCSFCIFCREMQTLTQTKKSLLDAQIAGLNVEFSEEITLDLNSISS